MSELDVLRDREGTCLIYVSDDDLYLRADEAPRLPSGEFPITVGETANEGLVAGDAGAKWMGSQSRLPMQIRTYEATRLTIPGPIPKGPEGNRIVSEALGRQVRHWNPRDYIPDEEANS